MTENEFLFRRTLGWGDFLEFELNEYIKMWQQTNKTRQDAMQDKKFIENLIKKGNEYQEQLNEEWLDIGFMTYKQYITQMNRYISSQDMVINKIKKYIYNAISFYTDEYKNMKETVNCKLINIETGM